MGQQDSKTIKLVYRYGLTAVALTSVLCFGGCWIFTPQIVSVFIRPQETALFGSTVAAFRLYSFCFLIMGYNVLTSGFFVALAKPKAGADFVVGPGNRCDLACLLAMSSAFGALGIWHHADGERKACVCLKFYFVNQGRNHGRG